MSELSNNGNETAALPPHAQLIKMGNAFLVSRIVFVAAKLCLADHLAEGPRSAAELAPPTGAHASSLYRLMRALASLGVLTEDADHRFALTPLGAALKKDAPGAARSTILTVTGQYTWRAWEEFPHAIETGDTAMEKAWGMPLFEFYAKHPQEASHFNAAMDGLHGDEFPAVAAAYDFSDFETVVDVGGGSGNLIAAILTRHPKVRGALLDLPHVIPDASALIEGQGLTDRIAIESGDFFEHIPAGSDAYLLKHIIHDWPEDQCLRILGNCRKAMEPGSRLLIIEMLLPSGDLPHPGKMLDIVMLAIAGGEERTEAQYRSLLSKAGFQLTRVVPTESAVSVLEAIPA